MPNPVVEQIDAIQQLPIEELSSPPQILTQISEIEADQQLIGKPLGAYEETLGGTKVEDLSFPPQIMETDLAILLLKGSPPCTGYDSLRMMEMMKISDDVTLISQSIHVKNLEQEAFAQMTQQENDSEETIPQVQSMDNDLGEFWYKIVENVLINWDPGDGQMVGDVFGGGLRPRYESLLLESSDSTKVASKTIEKQAAAEFLNKAVKPVMVGGPKLRVAKGCGSFVQLADACGYALAIMPSAKGLVPEHHPRFIGTYWGAVSTAFCAEIVESTDAYIFAGPIFNDYSSVGYSLLLKKEKAIIVQPDRVVIGNGPASGCILMKDFLIALLKRLKKNTTAFENYHRIYVSEGQPPKSEPKEPSNSNTSSATKSENMKGMGQLSVETEDSFSSLLEYAANNDVEAFRRMIELDLSAVDEAGPWYVRKRGSKQIAQEERTPLMVAATFGSVDVLKLIVALPEVDLNRLCGPDKWTALHCAAFGGSVNAFDVVKLLLSAGADPNIEDACGQRPVDLIVVPRGILGAKAALEDLFMNSFSYGFVGDYGVDYVVESFGVFTIVDKGIQPDIITSKILVKMYFKAGVLNQEKYVFDSCKACGIQPDVEVYKSMIMAYQKAKNLKDCEAIRANKEVQALKLPKEIYKASLQSFVNAGEARRADCLFNTMKLEYVPLNISREMLHQNKSNTAGQDLTGGFEKKYEPTIGVEVHSLDFTAAEMGKTAAACTLKLSKKHKCGNGSSNQIHDLQEKYMEYLLSWLYRDNKNVTSLGASIMTHSCRTTVEQQATRELTYPVDEKGTMIFVVEYFQETYGFVIQHTQWPCLQVGNTQRPNFLPIEVYKIVEGQSYWVRLNERQITVLLKVTYIWNLEFLRRCASVILSVIAAFRLVYYLGLDESKTINTGVSGYKESALFATDNGDDFFNNLPSPKSDTPVAPKDEVIGDSSRELDGQEESVDPSFDDAFQRALVIGDYKGAVAQCISANRLADALVNAHVGLKGIYCTFSFLDPQGRGSFEGGSNVMTHVRVNGDDDSRKRRSTLVGARVGENDFIEEEGEKIWALPWRTHAHQMRI